jgi:hypothetical protein
MSTDFRKQYEVRKGGRTESAGANRFRHAAIGIESEFDVVVDGRKVRPEDVFGDPRAFIRAPLVHRRGTSFHLPVGAAIYFDTGVIELATPVVEIAPGCAARAGRSLWEGICFVRGELDEWERRTGRSVRLVGYSTHYNVAFDEVGIGGRRRNIERLAYLLVHVLPVPLMLLVANRRSTGIGVRPRGNRVEVTTDFTPHAGLMVAAATFVTGVVREAMRWPRYDVAALEAEGIPVIRGFAPMPHTTRKGWLARYDCYPRNPFAEDADAAVWELRDGTGTISLRETAARTFDRFRGSIRRVADAATFRLIRAVVSGRGASLLDLPDRPPEYEDVGRSCPHRNLLSEPNLTRSRYERVLLRAISGAPLKLPDGVYVPTGMRDWSHVVFRRLRDGTTHVYSFDFLLGHVDRWERP